MNENFVELHVGDRIEDALSSRGTIRYIGPVATSKDETMVYYGVEWDEWGRGLNDGSVTLPSGEKKYYFQGPSPRPSATKGGKLEYKCSFVKKSKMFSDKMYERTTLIEMLRERYDHSNHSPPPSPSRAHPSKDVVIAGEVGTALGSEKPIQLVGVRKLRTQQTLETIEKISLSNCKIASIGVTTPGELGAMTPNITELNLASNLLSKWSDIFQVISELPLLDTLILSGNHLVYDFPGKKQKNSSHLFTKIQVLVLNNTGIAWKKIKQIVSVHFPSVTELYATDNEINDDHLFSAAAASHPEAFQLLETLDLSNNSIKDWQTLRKTFGSLANLKQLVLNGNQLQTIVTKEENAPPAFTNLRSLSLTDNLIDSWTSIDELNKYTVLDTLRFMRNPLVDNMGAGEARMIIIARAQYLMVFNGSDVRTKERMDAEQLYLKRILYEFAACGEEESEKKRILSIHPRYDQLYQQYPEIVTTALNRGGAGDAAGPSALSSTLIRVKFLPMSMKASSFESIEKRLPEKMRIAELKLLVKNKFSIEPHEQLLSFRPNAKSMPVHLDDDNCEVGYYGIQDGGDILINDI